MELISLGKEVLQNMAEKVASYRFGQSLLKQLDRALWVVEKCARWAVPPPLDQDERQPSDLVRPLSWVFFLAMLITLRITRESISLVNLVMGKPPLRSADVVTYIQSKRRYLRTLKYQGNRMMRARTSPQSGGPWHARLYALFQLTMCFRRSHNYGNNNTTSVSNNDEVMVIKRNKQGQQEVTPVACGSETTMERLIEKMMIDLDVESDEDSTYTLTNLSSQNSDSLCSDQDTLKDTPKSPSKHNGNISPSDTDVQYGMTTSTPEREKDEHQESSGFDNQSEVQHQGSDSVNETKHELSSPKEETKPEVNSANENGVNESKSEEEIPKDNEAKHENSPKINEAKSELNSPKENERKHDKSSTKENEENHDVTSPKANENSNEAKREVNSTKQNETQQAKPEMNSPKEQSQNVAKHELNSPKQESEKLIQSESKTPAPKKENKMANGKNVKSVPNKKKGSHKERQHSNEVLQPKTLQSNNSF